MKPIASDPVVNQGLAAAIRKALDADDPVSALEDNIERVAEAIVSGRAASGGEGFWDRALAAQGPASCGCGGAEPEAREMSLEDVAQLDEAGFGKATQGKRWEKLMR
jgi:hypothetical protein